MHWIRRLDERRDGSTGKMNPMKRDTTTRNVADYIAAAPKEVQARLKQIRAAIKEVAPNATEFISYGMPAYKHDKTFIGFAAMKNHIGLYPFTGSFVAAHQKELAGYSTSQSAIRLPLDTALLISLIKKIVKLRIKEVRTILTTAGGLFTSVDDHFREAYREGSPPWDIGKPDFNLIQTVTTTPIAPCKALEIGCGTGDNALWLSQQHFDVVGIDTSDIAIQKAKEKAAKADGTCTFAVVDFLRSHVEGTPFGFAFDRGCFHTLNSPSERKTFAKQVNRHLEKNGLWLSLVGSADEQRVGPGPPQRSARDVVNAVEPYFEILSLVSGHFGSNRPDPPRAWVCLMRKRRAG